MRREKRTLYKYDLGRFLGELAKLGKRLLSLVISVCLSAWNNSVPTGMIFMKFYI